MDWRSGGHGFEWNPDQCTTDLNPLLKQAF